MRNKILFTKSNRLIDFSLAERIMKRQVEGIYNRKCNQKVWFLEHDHVFTGGVNAKDEDILVSDLAPIVKTNRGGKFTYHGPGQRVIYVMLDLNYIYNNKPDVKLFINQLQNWVILTLQDFNIFAFTINDQIGVWVNFNGNICKIASIGVRIKRWISYHGIAININPDLNFFKAIIPCGLSKVKICSTLSLGNKIKLEEFDSKMLTNFYKIFNISNMDYFSDKFYNC